MDSLIDTKLAIVKLELELAQQTIEMLQSELEIRTAELLSLEVVS